MQWLFYARENSVNYVPLCEPLYNALIPITISDLAWIPLYGILLLNKMYCN